MYEPENLIDSLSYQEDDTSLLPNVLSATLEPRRPADENGACSPKIPPPFTTELANFSEPHFPLASFNEFAVGEDFEVHQGHFKLSDVNPDSKEASVSIHEDTSYFINNNLMNNYVSDTYSTMESAPSSTVTAPSEPRSLRKRSAEGKLEQRQSSSYAIKKASILSSPKTSIPFFKGTGEEEQSYLSCSEEEEEAVYCICRGPDDYTLMIQCGCCEEWFHANCVHLNEEEIPAITSYTCPPCLDSNEKSLKSSNNVAKDIVKVKSPVPTKEKKVSKTYTKKSQPSITKEGTNHAAIRQSAVDSFYKALSTCEEGKTYPDSSLRDIAKSIEASLFEAYPLELDPYGKDPKSAGGISLQYKSKFRSLLFNIKDNRNTNLRLRILSVPSGAAIENSEARYLHLSPKDLVRMNSEDLAPPSLRQEIEQTRQVTLEHQILDEEQLELVLGGIRRKSSITKPTIVEGPPALPLLKTDELAHTLFPESPSSSSTNEKISSPTRQSSLGLLDNIAPQDYSPESILKLLSTPSRYALPPKRKLSLNATSKNNGLSDSINSNSSMDAHTNNVGFISEPFSEAQEEPVWQGLIFMPELCVSFHKAISNTIFEGRFPNLSEFNLPIFLTVQGRMDSKKADTYLKQVFESPHRKLLVCPLQVQVANQAISESEEFHINNLVKSHEKFLKGTKLDKGDKLRSDLKTRNRYGVILSNHHKIFVGAKVTDWLIKDLYLLPTLASIPFLGKRKHLDTMSDAMFLVAVLSPALPLKKESPQNTIYSEAALNNDSFRYKPLTNIVPPHVYYAPIVPQSYPGSSLSYSEPNSTYSIAPSNPSAEDILSQLDSLANQ